MTAVTGETGTPGKDRPYDPIDPSSRAFWSTTAAQRDEAFAELPELSVPFTVIAGTAGPRGRWSPFGDESNDGVVAVSEARLGNAEPVLVPVIHTLLMDAVAVRAKISALCRVGRIGAADEGPP